MTERKNVENVYERIQNAFFLVIGATAFKKDLSTSHFNASSDLAIQKIYNSTYLADVLFGNKQGRQGNTVEKKFAVLYFRRQH